MRNITKGSKKLIKDLNRNIVINIIRERGPISRTAIAQNTGLERPTLTHIVGYLLEKNLIKEVGESESSGGRKPTLLDFNYDYGTIVGIKVESERVVLAVSNLAGKLLSKSEEVFPKGSKSDRVIKSIKKVGDRLIQRNGLLGIGIGISGFVSLKKEISIYSPILNWRNVNLAEPLEAEYAVPVFVDNDVNTLTLAEKWYGAGKGYKNFICITVGEGIGAGIVINGGLYEGNIGGAGEIGHTCISRNGPKCRCGERGCLEVFASDSFLIREARKAAASGHESLKVSNEVSLEKLLESARGGDSVVRKIFRKMGKNLGIGVKNIVNLLNPEAIILGGERMNAYEFFSQSFEEFVKRHSFPEEAKKLDIIPAKLGKDGWLIGAATLVIRDFFKLPL